MKILLVNKFNFLRGGADKYFLELAQSLEQEGHTVIKFCMSHPHNLFDKNEKYFVSYVDKQQAGILNKLRYVGRILYSFEARKKFEALLKAEQPDLIHLHNIYHQISPSILPIAKKYKIPVVMHLHDYKLISPNYNLFSRGKIDTSAVGGHYYRCFLNKTFNNSYIQSFLVTIEMYFHHTILKIFEKNISGYIAPSQFMKEMVVQTGIPEKKVFHIPYFVAGIENDRPNFIPGEKFLFFGRISEEKGIDVLLQALALVPSATLDIIGEGQAKKYLQELAHQLGVGDRVIFKGALFTDDLKQAIREARAVIVPSRWYEVFGLVNIEAAALGKLVIASDIAGIKEAVLPDVSAWLFTAGNSVELSQLLEKAMADSQVVRKAGEQGRKYVVTHFTWKAHWPLLQKVYKTILK